jgi:hypothetical protein
MPCRLSFLRAQDHAPDAGENPWGLDQSLDNHQNDGVTWAKEKPWCVLGKRRAAQLWSEDLLPWLVLE